MQFAGFINFPLFIFRFESNFSLESSENKRRSAGKKIYEWLNKINDGADNQPDTIPSTARHTIYFHLWFEVRHRRQYRANQLHKIEMNCAKKENNNKRLSDPKRLCGGDYNGIAANNNRIERNQINGQIRRCASMALSYRAQITNRTRDDVNRHEKCKKRERKKEKDIK